MEVSGRDDGSVRPAAVDEGATLFQVCVTHDTATMGSGLTNDEAEEGVASVPVAVSGGNGAVGGWRFSSAASPLSASPVPKKEEEGHCGKRDGQGDDEGDTNADAPPAVVAVTVVGGEEEEEEALHGVEGLVTGACAGEGLPADEDEEAEKGSDVRGGCKKWAGVRMTGARTSGQKSGRGRPRRGRLLAVDKHFPVSCGRTLCCPSSSSSSSFFLCFRARGVRLDEGGESLRWGCRCSCGVSSSSGVRSAAAAPVVVTEVGAERYTTVGERQGEKSDDFSLSTPEKPSEGDGGREKEEREDDDAALLTCESMERVAATLSSRSSFGSLFS